MAGNEIWILGATGRTGRAVAARLAAAQLSPVLLGRDTLRLQQLAGELGKDLRVVTAGSVDAVIMELSRGTPGVVINTIGPFTETAMLIATACPSGTHYIDVSNELLPIIALLGLHEAAVSSGRTLVTGAGFGVLATESVVLRLCEGQPPATTVRVDALPVVELEAGYIGSALAATVVESAALGGRRYVSGQLERSKLFGDPETLALPDGSSARTAAGPTGELEAARRASRAPFAIAASSMAPTAPLVRAILPAALVILQVEALRNFVTRRGAGFHINAKARAKNFSWAHARVQRTSGATREGWLRLGDAMAFTTAAVTEVAIRLAHGEGQAGAFTPGALFGPELAVHAGGQFIL